MANPNFENVSLLLPFNGSNGSTAFVDVSLNAHTITVDAGSPVISTAQSKWGGSSLRCDGSSQITTPDSAALALGLGHFTLDVWVWLDSNATTQGIASKGAFATGYDWILQYVPGSGGYWRFFGSGGTTQSQFGTPTANAWHFVRVVRTVLSPTSDMIAIAVDGVPGASTTSDFVIRDWSQRSDNLYVGGYPGSSLKLTGYADYLRITKGEALSLEEVPTEPFETSAGVDVRSSDSGPLGAPSMQAAPVYPEIQLAEPTALGSPSPRGNIPPAALAHDYGPLGSPSVEAYNDFSAAIDMGAKHIVADFHTSGGTVRLPISSFQATMQTGAQNYTQIVIPGAIDYVETLANATSFTVMVRAELADGFVFETELVSAGLDQVQMSNGPARFTATVSGYTPAYPANDNPSSVFDRAARGVRAIFDGSDTRVRCAVDWLLKPGRRFSYGNTSIIADYINVYVLGSDSYMDVGQRPGGS